MPKAFANSSPGVFQPWDSREKKKLTPKVLARLVDQVANAFSVSLVSFFVTQGWNNPGLELTNAFGVRRVRSALKDELAKRSVQRKEVSAKRSVNVRTGFRPAGTRRRSQRKLPSRSRRTRRADGSGRCGNAFASNSPGVGSCDRSSPHFVT